MEKYSPRNDRNSNNKLRKVILIIFAFKMLTEYIKTWT